MSNRQEEIEAPGSNLHGDPQPSALVDLFKSLEVTGKSLALYGDEHSITTEQLAVLLKVLEDFVAARKRVTCVFGRNILIVNENSYIPSEASQSFAAKLRARGTMAVTFVGLPSGEETLRFISFLNTEPKEIRLEGGPSDYLRRRAVSRIVLTEAVYTSDEDRDEDNTAEPRVQSVDVDRAIAYAIDWLSHQEEEGQPQSPRLPITEILSDPDKAARLIREAVSKLHVSRRHYTDGELATEVVNDLKDLACSDTETWDDAAPQIRKAISKLPKEMLPAASGFTSSEPETDDVHQTVAQIDEIEAQIQNILRESSEQAGNPDPERFKHLFGACPKGLLSNWRAELQPESVVRSSGQTLNALMNWEQNASEHHRIVNALAALIPPALELDDIDSALEFVGHLLEEYGRPNAPEWRVSAAKSALQDMETEVLVQLIDQAMKIGDRRAEEVCAGLVTSVRGLALSLIPMLQVYTDGQFGRALRDGIVDCRQNALVPLGALLKAGPTESKIIALELISRISGPMAVTELAGVVFGPDHALAIRALDSLATIRLPAVVEVCVKALNHSLTEVKCAAVKALGELQMDEAFDSLARLAKRGSVRTGDIPIRLALVEALKRNGQPEAIKCLETVAARAPIFGRARYEAVRESAHEGAVTLKQQLERARPKAA